MEIERRSSYYEQLPEGMKVRYNEKIQNCGNIDPYTINQKDLSTDRKDFPAITMWDIGNHLVYSISPFTDKMFKAYKSTEAYRFFESGFVLNVGSKKVRNSVIVKGNVQHSQRMNSTPLQAWFLAKPDGAIICGHCTCIAGLSETCTHVAALCFAVESITKAKETLSATDILCKWNVPKFSAVSMSKAKDIKWTSRSYEEASTSQNSGSTFRSYCNSLPHIPDDVCVDFINMLFSDGLDPAVRTILYPDEIHRVSNLKDDLFLADLYKAENINKTRSELVELGKSIHLQISNEDMKEIDRLTLPHLKSKIWLALRRGRVTEFNFKECCLTSIDNPSITTINRLISPMSFFDNLPGVRYQKKNKKKALSEYLMQVQEFHHNFQYQKSGLIINPEYPYFASSSDGLVFCDCHGLGSIEIKCLKILESEPFDVLMHKPYNILNKINDEFFLKESNDFVYKTQMQIHLSGSRYSDLVLWSSTQTLVVRVNADVEFWESAKMRALNFHQYVAMPELLGKYFTRRNEPLHLQESLAEYQLIGLEIEPIFSDRPISLMSSDVENDHSRRNSLELTDSQETVAEYECVGLEIEPIYSDGGNSFGSSDSESDQSSSITFTNLKTKSKLETESKTSYEKENFNNVEDKLGSPLKKLDGINILMKQPIKDILATFSEHQKYLKELLRKHVTEGNGRYKPKDIPTLAIHDIFTIDQQEAMISHLEEQLIGDPEMFSTYSDMLFDSILPEWAFRIFCKRFDCKRFDCTRKEAVELVRFD